MQARMWRPRELLHHEDPKVTKRVYRRKVPNSTPRSRQSADETPLNPTDARTRVCQNAGLLVRRKKTAYAINA